MKANTSKKIPKHGRLVRRGEKVVFSAAKPRIPREMSGILKGLRAALDKIARDVEVDLRKVIDHATAASAEGSEDARDAAEATAVMAAVRAGEMETFPDAVVGKLLDGENPVKVFREFRDMTGEELAAKVGISRPYITMIETGRRQPMFFVMVKIARVLDVSLDLLAPPSDQDPLANRSADQMETEELEAIADGKS